MAAIVDMVVVDIEELVAITEEYPLMPSCALSIRITVPSEDAKSDGLKLYINLNEPVQPKFKDGQQMLDIDLNRHRYDQGPRLVVTLANRKKAS